MSSELLALAAAVGWVLGALACSYAWALRDRVAHLEAQRELARTQIEDLRGQNAHAAQTLALLAEHTEALIGVRDRDVEGLVRLADHQREDLARLREAVLAETAAERLRLVEERDAWVRREMAAEGSAPDGWDPGELPRLRAEAAGGRGRKVVQVEVFVREWSRCIWRGELAGAPRAGDQLCVDEQHVETVRNVRWQRGGRRVQIELEVARADADHYPDAEEAARRERAQWQADSQRGL